MIIIIHPGSANLRIGLAHDSNPVTIAHAIAIKRNSNGGNSHRDSFVPEMNAAQEQLDESRLRVSHVLQSSHQSNGSRRYATPPQQISAFNRRSLPVQTASKAADWVSQQPNRTVVIGDDIFRVDPNADYNLHYPLRRGQFNLHKGVGGSVFNVLDNIHSIWEYAIRDKLGIPLRELSQYKAVLVIPNIFNRSHVKALTTLLLTRLGFANCFLVPDHVAALFGSGLGFGCVVDVGAEKTSVSCVDDGISQRHTRISMNYGGNDITQLFVKLLKKCAFPYQTCTMEDPIDFQLLSGLKEEKCHLNLDICGAWEQQFTVMRPNQPVLEYTMQFGDELLIAPLALFHTELLNRNTNRAQSKNIKSTGEAEDYQTLDNEKDVQAKEISDNEIMGIDEAILQSIEGCSTEEMRKKMYSSIVLVGGGVKFAGVEKWLQSRLSNQIPPQYRSESILASVKEKTDSAITTWKGAAIMSGLESASELWISQGDWEKHGVKMLREKAPFVF